MTLMCDIKIYIIMCVNLFYFIFGTFSPVQLFDLLTFDIFRVATAQGIRFLLFPDKENTGNFFVTQGKFLRHRENIFNCIY